jgi:hypothetical protein
MTTGGQHDAPTGAILVGMAISQARFGGKCWRIAVSSFKPLNPMKSKKSF